jgi:hypothetical protein
MPTDAKCGLLVGVGLVLAVAVMFFQKEPQPVEAPAAIVQAPATATAVKPPAVAVARPPDTSPVPGRPVSRTKEADPLHNSDRSP